MPPREPDRDDQFLLALRAAAAPLSAIGRAIPREEDVSLQADCVRLAHLRWLTAAAHRVLDRRTSELRRDARVELAEAVLCAEYEDPFAEDLPQGRLPRVRSLRPATMRDEAFVQHLATKLIEAHEADARPEGGAT